MASSKGLSSLAFAEKSDLRFSKMVPDNPHPFLRKVLLHLFRVKVLGTENYRELLKGGGVIVTCNHISYLDGILIALASPVPMVFPVDTQFSASPGPAKRLLNVMQHLGLGTVVPMDLSRPMAIKSLLRSLKRGQNVMIFPEGAISSNGQLQPLQPGASWLEKNSGAPVLGVRLSGAYRSRFFGKNGAQFWPKITLEFGANWTLTGAID